MKYFERLPQITYNGSASRNIFYSYVLDNVDSRFLLEYRVTDGESLFSISELLYGTQEHWWLLAVLNGIYDIYFDMPLQDIIIQEIADDELTDPYTPVEFVAAYDELAEENDAKRIIKIINPADMKRVLASIIKTT